jgi:hypothetical protein
MVIVVLEGVFVTGNYHSLSLLNLPGIQCRHFCAGRRAMNVSNITLLQCINCSAQLFQDVIDCILICDLYFFHRESTISRTIETTIPVAVDKRYVTVIGVNKDVTDSVAHPIIAYGTEPTANNVAIATMITATIMETASNKTPTSAKVAPILPRFIMISPQ